jgi:N-terminal domain of oxidoreductase
MPAAKQIVLASRPKGLPTCENFRLEEVAMPESPKGGLLLRVLYLSLDPYMRGRMDDRKSYAKPVGLGEVMTGESVCEVIASDQAGYSVGDIVLAPTGWRTHATSAGAALRKLDPAVAPITTGLGVLGMPGFTAYAGLNLIGKPKPGETVAVAPQADRTRRCRPLIRARVLATVRRDDRYQAGHRGAYPRVRCSSGGSPGGRVARCVSRDLLNSGAMAFPRRQLGPLRGVGRPPPLNRGTVEATPDTR